MGFYFNEGRKPTTADYALIYLPYYEGCKLNSVEISISNTNTSPTIKVAIANPNNLGKVTNSKNPTFNAKYTAKEILEMGTDISAQCCIYLHFNGVSINQTNCNYYIQNLKVDYILE